MKLMSRRAGTIAALIGLAAAGACNRSPAADTSLQADLKAASGGDLELASHSANSQLVVSPLEATPSATPQKAAPHRAAAPVSRPAAHVASHRTPAPHATVQHTPERVAAHEPAAAPAPVGAEPAPMPQPAARQPGVYKSEAEIFRQMPWIRP
jgi:hypothetical protein